MFNLFRTIRAKLLFAFFTFLLITTGFIFLADSWFAIKERSIQSLLDRMQSINLNQQRVEKQEYIFFKDELINEEFHRTKFSQILEQRRKWIQEIKQDLSFIRKAKEIKALDIDGEIKNLIQRFDHYESIFDQLKEILITRGFKNFGIEGRMRLHIHALEKASFPYDRAKMLMIRRHEKDFILRKQNQYIDSLHQAASRLRVELGTQPELLDHLERYEETFDKLVDAERQVGFTNDEGLKKQLKDISVQLNQQIAALNTSILEEASRIRNQNKTIQTLIIIIGTFLVFVLAFFVTRSLSKPISEISLAIHRVIENKFSKDVPFSRYRSNDEIGMLSRDVSYMIETVHNNIAEIKDQSEKIEKKQKILMEGVSYAKRIQQAILPDYEITHYFKKYFVLYRPRYDVSGDFYWFTELDGKYYLAVVDCTGQGVSGAFMSMIGNTLLNEVIDEKKIDDPPFILETLNTEFKMALHQNQRLSDDSMDICLCKIEPSEEKPGYWNVTYSGANRPLFYSDGWELHEIRGTTRSIGGRHLHKDKLFEKHSFELKKGNFLYLSTDGFVNQNNSEQKKYGTTRFKEFVRKILHLPVTQQEEKINRELDNFMEGTGQRDDITVFVLKL